MTIVVALLTSLLLRESDVDAVDPRLLTPFVRRWLERRRCRRTQLPPGKQQQQQHKQKAMHETTT